MTDPNSAERSPGTDFGDTAATYDRARPVAAPGALAWLLAGASVVDVLDLGAGTGALTRELRRTGHRVIALDPDHRMLRVLRAQAPQVPAIVGRAEGIPLPAASVDAVVVSAAWHWFDPVRAPHEIARVLRPRGRLGTVGTLLDPQVPWITEIYERLVVRDGRPEPWRLPDAPTGGSFSPPEREQFAFTVEAGAADVVDLVSTWSAVSSAPDRDRRLDWVARTARRALGPGRAPVPYRSYCARCDRTD